MTGSVRAVQIEGLIALQKDLRTLDKKLPAELRKVNLAVAQMVVTKAQATAASLGGVAAKAAPAIKAAAEQRGASVTLKASKSIPFAMGAEFGAGRGIRRDRKTGTYLGFNQFQPWKGNSTDAGYFMYPTIRGENNHIVEAYEKRLTELLAQVFPD
jgi:hypothetical protein